MMDPDRLPPTSAGGRRRRPRLALGLALLSVVGAVALAVPGTASAAPDSGAVDGAVPASVGEPATTPAPDTVSVNAVGIDLCAQVGYAAGFRGSPLVTAVAVAMAESSCNPSAVGSNGPTAGCPYGSLDRGLWQINNCYHPTVTDACAYDAQCNANAAYNISSGGSNWQPWSTYNSGVYANHLSAAQAAVNRLGGGTPGGVTGTILASPWLNVRAGPSTTSAVVGYTYYGSTVTISCYTFGEYVGGGYWPSSTWDRITDPATGATGFAADTWINTTQDVKSMVPSC
ncbi:transglycosylase SLT domain-containing protein [Micromonospora sp. LOL_015]|uniref:transglycosylase SLT domain-containing protein n=2 Tax=unclassified Micromonospora TaxID=2617518 RepID=UPI003A8765C5